MFVTYEIVSYDPLDYSWLSSSKTGWLIFFDILKNLLDDICWEFEESLGSPGNFPIDLSETKFVKVFTQQEGKGALPALSI